MWIKISIEFDPFPLTLGNKYWGFNDVLINEQNSLLMQLMPVMDLFGAFSLLITLVKAQLIEKNIPRDVTTFPSRNTKKQLVNDLGIFHTYHLYKSSIASC